MPDDAMPKATRSTTGYVTVYLPVAGGYIYVEIGRTRFSGYFKDSVTGGSALYEGDVELSE